MARFNFLTRGLQTLFPASGTEMHAPSLLREEVQLVHPYPGRARSWDSWLRLVATAGAAVTPTGDVVLAGNDEWVEVLHADTFHDSATARRILIRLVLTTGFTLEVARWEALVSSLAFGEPWFGDPVGTTLRITPERPLWVPPGAKLTQTGDTAGVAYSITTTMSFIRHSLHEEPSHL
jgi:hypothetical protein